MLTPTNSINQAALEYWRHSRYRSEDVDAVCQEIDNTEMAVRIAFDGNGSITVTVSQRTWERQQGHYPSIAKYFREIAAHPAMLGKKGSLIVLLEDGLWERHRKHAYRAPILTFGRHISDHYSLLMPDPAFIKSNCYFDDRAMLRTLTGIHPWESTKCTAFWRGASTGIGIEEADWIKAARGRLTLLARDIADASVLDAKFSKISHLGEKQQELFRELGIVDRQVPFEDFLKFRYVIDADGYCCAWQSLFLKLSSPSLVMKIESPYEQWYFRKLVPWRHFVPLMEDLSNFRECFDWLKAHDSSARAIAEEGAALMNEFTYEETLNETVATCRELLECWVDVPSV